MARVTVVIPAYNAEAFLAETLASIEAQTYDDWDAVVADDASTDDTAGVVHGRDARIRVVRTEVNGGPAAARNRALRAASGELVAFLDADDQFHPNYLERMVQLYDAHSEKGLDVGVVACDARLLRSSGIYERTYMELNGFPDHVTMASMLVSNAIPPGSMTRRGLVEELGGFCPELFGTEDYDLWLRVLETGHGVAYTREPLVVYRVRSGSVSSNLPRMARALQLTYQRALERGALTPDEVRIAERQLRLQRALEEVGLIIGERRAKRVALTRVARNLPLFVRVALENPDRWGTAIRTLSGRGSPLSQIGK